jgi:diguanylate cyclase (GGDEF)-like protein
MSENSSENSIPFKETLDNLPNLVLVANPELEIILSNKNLRKAVGLNTPQINTPIKLSEYLSAENLEQVKSKINLLTPSSPETKLEFAVPDLSTENNQIQMDWVINGIFNENGQLQKIIGIGKDITDIKNQEKKLKEQTEIDPLTQIYSRHVFEIQKDIENNRRQLGDTHLFVVDIDNLKQTNDKPEEEGGGHLAGDKLIATTAEILRTTFRQEDIICRIGGDEFAIIARFQPDQIDTLLERLSNHTLEHNLELLKLKSREAPVNFSIGYSVLKDEPLPFDYALQRADKKMYEQKRLKKEAKIPLITEQELTERLITVTS